MAMLPKVSTCDCSRSWSALSEEEFKSKLSECILCSTGYGQV